MLMRASLPHMLDGMMNDKGLHLVVQPFDVICPCGLKDVCD